MQIGLLGYGKMGRAIEALAPQYGATIVWRIGHAQRADLTPDRLREAEVVIEFSRPEAAFANVLACLEAGVPVVCGTTGWQAQLPEAEAYCRQQDGAFLWASNFSVGVNLFFALNEYLAQLMAQRPEYAPAMTEIHHIHKLDAPSGTAVTLAEHLQAAAPRVGHWQLQPTDNQPDTWPITSVREGEVPGTHRIEWANGIDQISIEHRAHSRDGFAMGALVAARWLRGRSGVFSMRDVLGV
jgi:4-hydroxy-tetrahydrodipicolinate reductase